LASIDSCHIYSIGPKSRSTTKTKRKRRLHDDNDDDGETKENGDDDSSSSDVPNVVRTAVEDAAAAAWSIDMIKQRELYDEADVMAANPLRDARYISLHDIHLLTTKYQ
jgi:hypothetical protein